MLGAIEVGYVAVSFVMLVWLSREVPVRTWQDSLVFVVAALLWPILVGAAFIKALERRANR